MLVTLAVLLIMMTVVVKIFQAAAGSLSSAQVCQELDNQLRLLDATIRSDLNGVTAKLTPLNDPKNNTGYLEYGENEFADLQGEDSDDYIRFTAKAPAGRPFTGRMWVPPSNSASLASGPATALFLAGYQPITITSEYAEIIYFLRNGNLYRRVLLVAPERQSTIVPTINNTATFATLDGNVNHTYNPSGLGGQAVSWQGVNDLSARPAASGSPVASNNSVILNTLADLTNRENRFAYQRFSSDFQDISGNLVALGVGGDGLDDDVNADNVPDYYPTLYPTVLAPVNASSQLLFEPNYGAFTRHALGVMAFPFVFPGAYSVPQTLSNYAFGWIHSPNPEVNVGTPTAPVGVIYEGNANGTTLDYLKHINHNPLDTGDNLSLPANQAGYQQTWWGFPTWRETLSPIWEDPTVQVNVVQRQPNGLASRAANVIPSEPPPSQFLPAMTGVYRNTPQPYNDGFGASTGFFTLDASGNPPALWLQSWEDDLIMTGVRSFDIKAYDNSVARYVDLGWGDDLRFTGGATLQYLNQTPPTTTSGTQIFDTLNQTFAHEGRMPPLQNDFRYDAQYGQVPLNTYGVAPNYTGNVGDDNPAVVRLRRVWDSWSTEYSWAPGTGVNPGGFPAGPPFSPPVYPSYPPPYPAPLRGIQIQIRVTDPTNQRVKSLTIRQDFTDKL